MRRRSLRSEVVVTLECRRLLAGNVRAVLSGSTLTVTGDNSNNDVAIEQTVDGLRVRAFGGTKLNGIVNGAILMSNRTEMTVDLKGGNDRLNLSDYLGGDVSVQMGSGNDTLTLSAITTDGDLVVDLNSGNDRLEANLGGELQVDTNVVGGNCSLLGGSGNENILIRALNVLGHLSIDASSGNDNVGVGSGRTNGTTSILLGEGNDNAGLENRTSAGTFSLNAGNGNDLVGAQGLVMQEAAIIDLGNGKDALLTQGNSFMGNLTREGGTGIDTHFSLNDTHFAANNITGFEVLAPSPAIIAPLVLRLQTLFGLTF